MSQSLYRNKTVQSVWKKMKTFNIKTVNVSADRFEWTLREVFKTKYYRFPANPFLNLFVSSEGKRLPIILFDAVLAWNSFIILLHLVSYLRKKQTSRKITQANCCAFFRSLQPRFSRQVSAEYVNAIITGYLVTHFCCIDIKVLFFWKIWAKCFTFFRFTTATKNNLPKYKYYQFFLLN